MNDGLNDESWARVDLRVESETLTVPEIEQHLGQRSQSVKGRAWEMYLTADSGSRLADQLVVVKEYLRDRVEVFAGLGPSDISLNIGWTPRDPQDGIILDLELVDILSRMRCYVLLDTYLD